MQLDTPTQRGPAPRSIFIKPHSRRPALPVYKHASALLACAVIFALLTAIVKQRA